MTPEERQQQKAQRLELLESAAAAAIFYGATPDEVQARVRVGVDEMLDNANYQAAEDRARAA